MSRERWTHRFLWFSISAWGIAVGAKIYDLLVLGVAWGGAAPDSLAFYPYGKHWPINPGNFFQPLSVLILIAIVGALISGWKTVPSYRRWLWLSLGAFVLIWIATPTMFWPIINDLYQIANHRPSAKVAETATLIRHWFLYDSIRILVIATGFVASVKAISLPYRER